MKVISLWQPWAQLIVRGDKLVETRGWSTRVRGTIAIHAALRKPDCSLDALRGVNLPLGAIVGTAEIVDCVNIENLYGGRYDTPFERSYGNWDQGRFGWVLQNPFEFDIPIIIKGRQGIWTWNEADNPRQT